MLGSTLKHKIFSAVGFALAAAVFFNLALNLYQQGAVTFDTVSGFAAVLFIVSMALIPEFFFLKLSHTLQIKNKSRREKLAEKLLYSAILLVIFSTVGRLLLHS